MSRSKQQRDRLVDTIERALEGSPIAPVNSLYWTLRIVNAIEALLDEHERDVASKGAGR